MIRNAIAHFTSASGSPTMNGRQLFKYLMRQCNNLPKDAQQFYRFSIKQSFKQYVQETDPERIQEIISKALKDSKWVIAKYENKST